MPARLPILLGGGMAGQIFSPAETQQVLDALRIRLNESVHPCPRSEDTSRSVRASAESSVRLCRIPMKRSGYRRSGAGSSRERVSPAVEHMKVLITGGCGFIGCNTAKRLAELGHTVTLLDD